MLARRFTIVCLVTAIFGMGLAMLVADAGSGRSFGARADSACADGHGGPCLAPIAQRYFARP